MRIIAYGRTSTDDQKLSITDQEQKLKQYAALHDHVIVETILEHESAESLDRPGLQRALAMLRSGEADGLLVCKLDRLCRSLRDFAWLIETFFGGRAKYRRTLMSVQDSVDTKTAAGMLVLDILMVVAAWELATIRERTKSALAVKIRNHELVGAVPYGWDLDPGDRKKLVPNGREQEGLAHMLNLRDEGRSLREIAARLEADGYKTKTGKPWSFSTVGKVLRRKG